MYFRSERFTITRKIGRNYIARVLSDSSLGQNIRVVLSGLTEADEVIASDGSIRSDVIL